MSTIEWTDETWNPTLGCSRVSPGCDGCYAIGVAHRAMQPAHAGLTDLVHDASRPKGYRVDWTGEVRCLPDRLDTPLHWRKPRRVFVDSMSDLFHPDVPDVFISRVWETMASMPQHTYQVLTKRPQRMAKWVDGCACSRPMCDQCTPLSNVWLGTSVENQRYADLRIPHLLATPAAVRFLSIEPLLGPVKLHLDWLVPLPGTPGCGTRGTFTPAPPGIDWVIVGGESGPGARPMHPQWVRDLRDQCTAAGVPFFFKQWGEFGPGSSSTPRDVVVLDDGQVFPFVGYGDAIREAGVLPYSQRLHPTVMHRLGKKAAGCELDGRTWEEYPA